jgi:serine/threonine protein kinase
MVQAKADIARVAGRKPGIPERIGKYVIINEVGQGSSGRVYLSHDPYYGRDVAIKLYNIDADEDEQKARVTRKMFFNEAQMMGRLQHPNILPIYDAGEENGGYYVVTEHIHGARTLAAYCKPDNLLRVDDVVEIIFKCAKALNYAHSRGVVHRDIKPSNIMLTLDNDVRIIDFGIALVKDSDVSRIEGIAGSPSYMSPEQVQSAEITSQSDLYSLGAVTYELLTGFRPFRANSLSKLLHQIVYATPAPIHTLRSDISEELEEIVSKMLQKAPGDRFANGLELAGKLTQVFQTLRSHNDTIDKQARFDTLRTLRFFHDFSHSEIWMARTRSVCRASSAACGASTSTRARSRARPRRTPASSRRCGPSAASACCSTRSGSTARTRSWSARSSASGASTASSRRTPRTSSSSRGCAWRDARAARGAARATRCRPVGAAAAVPQAAPVRSPESRDRARPARGRGRQARVHPARRERAPEPHRG